jgi:hypothetical protein
MLNRWSSSGAPSLALDFISGSTLDSRITFTRASSATRFNASGVMETVGSNVARFDYNPATLAIRGLLIEEQRTNTVRNNTMVGAVAGAPGTVPTGWTIPAAPDGLAREIVSVGTENGIEYIDLRYSGTLAAGGVGVIVATEVVTNTAAANGQTWTAGTFFKLVAGTWNGINVASLSIRTFDSGSVLLENLQPVDLKAAVTGTLTRQTGTVTLANASTAFINSGVRLVTGTAGAAVDFTLRIGVPQLELGGFATSTIKTTNAQATRTADVATMSPGTWFNAATGTLLDEHIFIGSGAGTTRVAQIDDGTENNRIVLADNSTMARGIVTTGAASQADAVVNFGAQSPRKSAYAWAANDFQIAAAGALGTADTSGTVPSVNILRLGGLVSPAVNGAIWLRSLKYYARRLPNPQLQSLTL